jgi:amino acid transporter
LHLRALTSLFGLAFVGLTAPYVFWRGLGEVAWPLCVGFLGFDGISTLAEDAKDPQKNVARATVLVCFVAGALFILQTYLGQLIWPDYSQFHPIETAFSDIGRLIGGLGLFFLIEVW